MLRYSTANLRLGRGCRLFLLLLFIAPGCKRKPAPAPPPEVLYITATPTNVPVFDQWIGTLVGLVDAQIRAQVTGYLWTQNYRDGSFVKKGELLFEIDPRPFQAVLDQAAAKLAQDEAAYGLTQINVKRYTPLAKEQAISQQTLDDAVQSNYSAQALVQADKAAIETARLNLGFTRITSLVDGIAGISVAQIGDLVGPNSISNLTTVSTVNPIRDFFQVTEQSYLNSGLPLVEKGSTNAETNLELILANGSVFPYRGKFYAAERQINPTTGTLQIVGLFPNPGNVLRPGQYGLVRAQTAVATNVFFIPQRAVNQLQGSYQVMLVGASNKVQFVNVKVGRQIGSDWVIESGLKAGDRVVVEGVQKAKEGAVVNPKPFTPQSTNAPPANTGS